MNFLIIGAVLLVVILVVILMWVNGRIQGAIEQFRKDKAYRELFK